MKGFNEDEIRDFIALDRPYMFAFEYMPIGQASDAWREYLPLSRVSEVCHEAGWTIQEEQAIRQRTFTKYEGGWGYRNLRSDPSGQRSFLRFLQPPQADG